MSKPIFRVDEIKNLCKSKTVLHLGYIQHDPLYKELHKKKQWLHFELSQITNELVGIDYLKSAVIEVKEEFGFEGYFVDVQNLDELNLDKKFDVILCGELIEHLTNPGIMLEGIKRFMHKDSILILTTPNCFAKEYRKLFKKEPEINWVNSEHVAWFSFFTLSNMLKAYGYIEVKFDYYFGFNKKCDYFLQGNGLLNRLKNIKRKELMKRLPREEYLGLFFISKLS